jgi:hypothetical protein
MFSIMRALFFAAIFVAFLQLGRPSAAQDCPRENPAGPSIDSMPRTLVGTIVFHDDMRQWLSIDLDAPVCGQNRIEIFDVDYQHPRQLEVFRGCRVTTRGVLGIPSTGYYSTDVFQTVDQIEPTASCVRQPAFPDYEKMKPVRGIYTYQVSMWFNYGPFEDRVHARVLSGNRILSPWQAYAHYFLTGGFGFYGYCADGYTMSHMVGTPEAKPWMIDNSVAMDPETAAADKNVHAIKLSFTCNRRRPTTRKKN